MSIATEPIATDSSARPTLADHEMTADQFETWAFAQELATYEWVEGKIIMMAPVSDSHNDLNRWLIVMLSHFVEEQGLGIVRYDMFVRMPNARRVPDLFVLKKENLARLTSTALNGPPDLAIEIISPDSGSRDWREKFIEYESLGIGEYWMLDPLSQVAECYALGEDHRFHPVVAKDGAIASTVLPGFYLRIEWLWQKPLPRVAPLLREMGVSL